MYMFQDYQVINLIRQVNLEHQTFCSGKDLSLDLQHLLTLSNKCYLQIPLYIQVKHFTLCQLTFFKSSNTSPKNDHIQFNHNFFIRIWDGWRKLWWCKKFYGYHHYKSWHGTDLWWCGRLFICVSVFKMKGDKDLPYILPLISNVVSELLY